MKEYGKKKTLNLALWDFWLFPKLKSLLKGRKYQAMDEMKEKMMKQLMMILKEGFAKWLNAVIIA